MIIAQEKADIESEFLYPAISQREQDRFQKIVFSNPGSAPLIPRG